MYALDLEQSVTVTYNDIPRRKLMRNTRTLTVLTVSVFAATARMVIFQKYRHAYEPRKGQKKKQ